MGIVRHAYRELSKCNVYGPTKLIQKEEDIELYSSLQRN